MVECVVSCEDCIVFLFVVIGFVLRTSCILILLYIVVCRGRGSFVSMCISANVGSFISSCFSNVHGSHHEHIMLLCVFYFRVRASCSRHGVCPCVHICWRREESLWLNSFAMKNFQNTWCSCFLLVCMAIRIIPQSGACFGAKLKSMRRTLWQSGESWHVCWRR